jgi:hypothetical protein
MARLEAQEVFRFFFALSIAIFAFHSLDKLSRFSLPCLIFLETPAIVGGLGRLPT